MSRWMTACASVVVACGGGGPTPRGPEPIEVECEHVAPAGLAVAPETLATAETPRTFELPEPLLLPMMRTGKVKFIYSVGICGGTAVTRGDVTHSTGFPDLDQLLDVHLADFHLAAPAEGCTTATIVVSIGDHTCESRKVLD